LSSVGSAVRFSDEVDMVAGLAAGGGWWMVDDERLEGGRLEGFVDVDVGVKPNESANEAQ
jgi:hypothetical protein